jgi:hypothetical protein
MTWSLDCGPPSVTFRIVRAACVVLGLVCAQAATLEHMSTDDMIARSTAIVRGRVVSSSARLHGPLIYTHYIFQVSERLKGPEAAQLDVVLPGGAAGGLRQTFPGTPALTEGGEYLLFLWSGPSGLTHVIGLSQGVFTVSQNAGGELTVCRPASTEVMLDSRSGRVIADQPVRLRLRDLRSRVAVLSQGEGSGR